MHRSNKHQLNSLIGIKREGNARIQALKDMQSVKLNTALFSQTKLIKELKELITTISIRL